MNELVVPVTLAPSSVDVVTNAERKVYEANRRKYPPRLRACGNEQEAQNCDDTRESDPHLGLASTHGLSLRHCLAFSA